MGWGGGGRWKLEFDFLEFGMVDVDTVFGVDISLPAPGDRMAEFL